MTNYQDCPECGKEIDVVEASLQNKCYECDTHFYDLLR